MIDVTFLLLLYFMVTTVLAKPEDRLSPTLQTQRDSAVSSASDFQPQIVEVMRIGAFLKTFHFQSVYDYVLQRAYLHEPSFQRYISERAEKIREAGFDTNIWSYQSSHE